MATYLSSMESYLRVSAELAHLAVIRRFVQEAASALGADGEVVYDMLAAVDEAVSNIILHGYHGQPGSIEVELRKEGEVLIVCLRDQAPLFDPTLVPPPDLTLPLEERRVGGLGIYLIRHFTDAMTHRVTPDGGNEMTLTRKLNSRSFMGPESN
jgi:anti-sigma regulatory factor (Ser/Thr protein kinase)